MSRTVVAASTSPSEQPLLAAEDPEQSARAPAGNENAILQFSTELFFATEGEDHQMQIDVVRLGDSTGVSKVDYKTVDASAKAGEKYEATSGTLTFEAGEHMKSITVEILDDDKWNATLEFKVDLENPQGAQLGKYLHTCRVKVIDDDLFPTNKYAENFKSGTQEEIPGAGLFFEYIKLCLHDPQVKWKTIKCILLDQLKGVYFFITMWLQLYMIDTVLHAHAPHGEAGEAGEERLLAEANSTSRRFLARALHEEHGEGEEEGFGLMLHALLVPGSRRQTAMLVAAVYIVPFFLIHLTDFWMCFISLRGSIRKLLQANLLRKFLNYKEEIRPTITLSQIQMAMVRDVQEVVEFGFMKLLSLARIFGKLTFAMIFILAESPVGSVPLLVCPVILGIFLWCRESLTMGVAEAQAHAQDDVVQHVTDTVKNFRVIADFSMRPKMVDTYETSIDHYDQKECHQLAVLANNSAAAPLLSTLIIGIYIVFATYMITSGAEYSIGTFVTTINVFKEVGKEIQEITLETIEIQRTFEPLQKIANYMNMPTDMADRKRINRMRRQDGASRREDAKKTKAEGAFAVDAIPISVKDLSFKFGEGELLLSKVTAEWEQGKLYAFVGPAHQGKGTLLKLLGQVYMPHEEEGGNVFVPPHLRILHLHNEALIMHGTLMQNLLLGQSLERVGGMERVRRICTLLRFEPKLLEHLSNEDSKSWHTLLTDTASSRLTLARAFLMNAEVMALHKPLSSFNKEEARRIMQLLRQHVAERGLELPEAEQRLRRPRTVFFTAGDMEPVAGVDKSYRISRSGGVEAMRVGK
mmetsp:Transcript_37274/g.112521  ORF Transcript_37274/g.112521 Transcript_37274/m.112521 type:complete len:809 (-) Transcript_37274:21-2447(-)